MKYLEAKVIIKLNQKILSKVENYPTKFAEPNGKEILEDIVNQSKQQGTPIDAAAVLMHNLNMTHVFKSANKRTSFLAGELLLGKNGIRLGFTDGEAAKLSKDIRNNKVSIEQLKKRLEESSRTKNYAGREPYRS